MKKFLLFLIIFGFFINCIGAQTIKSPDRPKLIIGIVVDQMRWDFLYRYYDRYGNDGFKRLLNEGASVQNVFINHLPTATSVGHATIFTGSVPAIHGIVGNEFIYQITGRLAYCVEDTTVETVGSSSDAGKMSPRNLLVTTVTDELRMATNFRSKVVGISLKDRAAILPAGHAANGAFWFDPVTGYFITSSYYMNQLPEWVNRFNNKNMPEKLIAHDWNTLYPINTYQQSTSDDVPWEGLMEGEESPTFPHKISKIYPKDKMEIKQTPFGNSLTLEFAKAALDGYAMGQGDFTDFLTINLAATDGVGHRYGPNSIEIEDTYLRLDKDLANFLSYLDRREGKGNYLLFLTADHGGSNSIGFLKDNKLPGGYSSESLVADELKKFLMDNYGNEDIVVKDDNWHFKTNRALIKMMGLNYEEVKRQVCLFLQSLPRIQFAIDLENIGNLPIPEPLKTMALNGYNSKRIGNIQLIRSPGVGPGNNRTVTTHNSWSPFSSHIPLVFMGWKIPHKEIMQTYHQQDIAPTIASLLHIQMGSGNVGKVITEIFE